MLVRIIILVVKYGNLKKIKLKASSSNAAMGLSVPLSIGAAVASNKQIMSVTGDGSIELIFKN